MIRKALYFFIIFILFTSSATAFEFYIDDVNKESVQIRFNNDTLDNKSITEYDGKFCLADGTNCNFNVTVTSEVNITEDLLNGTYLRLDSENDPLQGDLNMGDNRLTDVGQLIMSGITNTQDIVPLVDDLYSLGNETHRFKEAYINDLYSENVYSDNATIGNIDSDEINSDNVEVNENITMGNITITRSDDTLIFII